jgi:hypothetical protein
VFAGLCAPGPVRQGVVAAVILFAPVGSGGRGERRRTTRRKTLYYLLAAVVLAAVIAFVVFQRFGARVRCPFCREWLPRGATYLISRPGTSGPYSCPFCDHIIRRGDLKGA